MAVCSFYMNRTSSPCKFDVSRGNFDLKTYNEMVSKLGLPEPTEYVCQVVSRDFTDIDGRDLERAATKARERLGLIRRAGFEFEADYHKGQMDNFNALALYYEVREHIFRFSSRFEKSNNID